jgi:hypothetical protein
VCRRNICRYSDFFDSVWRFGFWRPQFLWLDLHRSCAVCLPTCAQGLRGFCRHGITLVRVGQILVLLQYPLVPFPSLDLIYLLLDRGIISLVLPNRPCYVVSIPRVQAVDEEGELVRVLLRILKTWEGWTLEFALLGPGLGAIFLTFPLLDFQLMV